ncbi:type 1 glutamine amidotransferase [Yoonia sediminilitoris]|uniref:GMP synthase-like glutamine amidotransferase n=1 Tax=Yoonia sediminilitoris TaxID=1286148 RepID=A0A2T6KEY0_9RHOB|nr:type 1 glutamine amidotransferase [Yoonia sediminilitoris]PUB13686.1 GMP synthase-like glutamine amidotransferase [Yoonia sediminilitoris]RCW94856.1 GMP synthase-like glutamine amidotransferase [Yoonia sediminilitoris]
MKIGILQTGHPPDQLRPDYGDYDRMFADLLDGHGFAFASYDVEGMVFPKSVTDCDGWLITGSRHSSYEDHPFIPRLEAFVRAAYAADVPIVGICFGHQIIAQALGGRVAKYPQGWAVGRQTYDWQGKQVAINAWHQDQVIARPAAATVCASSAFCENAALVYDKRIFTVQAHPEFDSEFTGKLAQTRGKGVVPQALLDQLHATQDLPIDTPLVAHQIATFFKERRLQ